MWLRLYTWICIFCGVIFYGIAQGQQPLKLGKVTSSSITEISGIVPYSYDTGYFWVHNDSGDDAYIYLIDSVASLRTKVKVEGAKFIDIEDIARFSKDGKSFLLIADIGNNLRNREILNLYIIEEPKIGTINHTNTLNVSVHKEIKIKYADKRRDAEAIFVDPVDNQVYIVSKRDFQSVVFSLQLDIVSDSIQILEPKLELPFTFATAADISTDGKNIVIKNLTQVFLWDRDLNASIIQTLKNDPRHIPYVIEPQGEAICFDLLNRYLYTISERPFGLESYLYKYEF